MTEHKFYSSDNTLNDSQNLFQIQNTTSIFNNDLNINY